VHSIGRVLHCPFVVPCAAVGLLLASPARAHDRLDLLIARATRALAKRGTGARLHVEVDGADKTGTLSVPDTGGWQAWPTITKSGISLTAGSHAVRLVFDTATALYGGGRECRLLPRLLGVAIHGRSLQLRPDDHGVGPDGDPARRAARSGHACHCK
jgi:hypothetical protein